MGSDCVIFVGCLGFRFGFKKAGFELLHRLKENWVCIKAFFVPRIVLSGKWRFCLLRQRLRLIGVFRASVNRLSENFVLV